MAYETSHLAIITAWLTNRAGWHGVSIIASLRPTGTCYVASLIFAFHSKLPRPCLVAAKGLPNHQC